MTEPQPDVPAQNDHERIQKLAREFQRLHRDGKAPAIESFLAKIASSNSRQMLFSNLLQIDLRLRERQGDSPDSAEYIQRFPQYARLIRQAFFESTMGSIDAAESHGGAGERSDGSRTQLFGSPASGTLGDYELTGELGRGGMGVVYEARHLKRHNRVALKTLPVGVDGQEVNADRLHKFRKEFRSLSEINHPNLVGMQTLEVDGNQWFFTMDLIEGDDFLGYVRPDGEFNESRLRSAVAQLASGIVFLHETGIVHRDLKPSNVMVAADGRVVILDFGLVAQLQSQGDMTVTRSGMFAGTPRYAAPEQMFGERSEASDWYAFGTMLYEALTGGPPFTGSQMELLQLKQNEDPPTISGDESLPGDLAQLADGLLKREPSRRPTTSQIVELLQLDLETRTYGSTQGSAGSHGSAGSVDEENFDPAALADEEIVLVGREEQLAQLESAKEEFLEKREPRVVWITGKSGEGKSSLAEKFLGPLRLGDEMLVLSGRCYDRESVPFKAIDSFIDPLTSYLRLRPADWLTEKLPQDFHLLAKLFPALSRVKSTGETIAHTDRSRMDERQVRYRAFYAMRELLTTIGKETPLIVFVDDLQWGDSDSAEVMNELLAPTSLTPVLFLGGYRSDEFESSPFIGHWEKLHKNREAVVVTKRVSVEPLTEEQCLELVASRIGLQSERIRHQSGELFSDTRGNPYFIEQLIEGYDSTSDRFEHIPLDEVIARKLARLPRESTDLLLAIAIAGQAVRLDEASQVAGIESEAYSVVAHMRSERLVRLVGSADNYAVDTYHDKIRETVVGGLDDDTAVKWHARYAKLLEAKAGIDIDEVYKFFEEADPRESFERKAECAFDLAYHFEHAGDIRRAFGFTMLAAEQASQSYANDEAADAFTHAEEMLPKDLSRRIHFRLCLGIGQARRRKKQTENSVSKFEQAIRLADSKFDKAVAFSELGIVYDQLGLPGKARKLFDTALNLIGEVAPKTTMEKLLSVALNSFRTIVVPASWQQFRRQDNRRRAQLRSEILHFKWLGSIEKNLLDAAVSAQRFSIATIQSGNAESLTRSHAASAIAWSANGSRWLGNLFLSRSRRENARIDDLASRGRITQSQGFCNYWLGDLADAQSELRQSLEDLDRCGDYVDLLLAMHMLRHTEFYIGSTSSEVQIALKVRTLAHEVGSARCICWGEYDVAAAVARRGDLTEAMQFMANAWSALVGERYMNTESIRDATHSYVMIQASQFRAAAELAAAAWAKNRESLVLVDTSMFCIPLMVESQAGPNWLEPVAEADRKPLKRAVRLAAIFYFTQPNHQPHLLRVSGRAAMTLGKRRKAVRKFKKAIKLAKKKGMDYQRAKSLLDLAAVEEKDREANRSEAIELLKKMESVIPRAESWLLGDQYDEEVVAPEFDLEAWEKENGPVVPYLEDVEV